MACISVNAKDLVAYRVPGVPVPELGEDTPHPSHSAVRGQ